MELRGGRAGFAAPAATAGWERQGQRLLCCKPVVLIPVMASTIHWTSLLAAQTFQGSYLGKIRKLTMAGFPPHHSAAPHNCCSAYDKHWPATWKLSWSGVIAQVWHLQCLCGVSSGSQGKCSKHWEKQYFVDCLSRWVKNFAVISCHCLLFWIRYRDTGLGKGAISFLINIFQWMKKQLQFSGITITD